MSNESPIEPDFETLFASAPGLYMVLDPGLRIVAATEAYLRETLTRRADILGRHVFDVFPDNPGDPSADAVQNSTASYRRVLESHVTDVMGLQRHDVRKPEAEGGGWEVRYWNATNSPVLKPDGSLAYIMHRVENVTELVLLQEQGVEQTKVTEVLRAQAAEMKTEIAERRRAEAALRESESRFRSLSEDSKNSFVILSNFVPQLVWMCTPDGLNIYFNQRWTDYTGLTLEESYGRGWNTPFHPDDQLPAWNAWNKAVQTGAQYSIECRLRAADGSYRRFLIRGEPMRDISGGVLRWLGTCTDIEDLRQESEERLRLALAAAELGAWDYDPVTGALVWDARCKELFGLGPEVEVNYDMFLAGVHPDDRERANQVVQRSFDPASDGLFDIEYRTVGLRDGGVVRWVHATGRASFNTASEAIRFIGTVQDITGRKRAEEALRASEASLKRSQEIAHLGSWELDLASNRLTWSDEVYRIFGLQPQEFAATYQAFLERVHPDDRAAVDAAYSGSVRDGRESYEIEHRVVRKDTGEIRYVREKCQHVRDAQGRIALSLGMVHDVTEHKRAGEALAASENRLRALLESAAQGVVAVDATGRILLVNARTEDLFGYSRGELIGQPLELLVPEHFQVLHAGYQRQYFESPRTRQMGAGLDLRGRKKDGGDISMEISLSFVEEGGKRLALALITDIAERKHAEERLRQTQKLESLGLLAGGVAHDFNNLLVGVIGNASLAQELLPPDHPAVELMDEVLKAGEQAAHLTRQMLAYSGKGKFLVEPLNLSALIPDMCGLVRPSISKKIGLQLELEEDLPRVEADRGQVQQVFMNLAINAAEAIGSEGLITVRTGVQDVDEPYLRLRPELGVLAPGRYVCLEVRDTGSGMDEATKAKIFDPFFSTKFTGRGLGLAAVSGILRGHRCGITVSSAPGKGSCFTVLFPATTRAEGKGPVVGRDASLRGAGTILVVDDEQFVREMAKRALERLGYTVLMADGGAAAIDVFRRHPGEITLVVLDLSMPHMSGEEALLELRKIRPETKVVVSSGYSESEAMPLFDGQRVSGFVQKPYTSMRIAEKVKECLGQPIALF